MSRSVNLAAVTWGVALLGSRLLGLVRDAVLGATLGVGREADVYAAAFRIPDLMTYVVSGGALGIVFIPMFTRLRASGEEDRAWRAFSVIANFVLLLALVLVPPLLYWMPELCARSFPGFDAESAGRLVFLSRMILPSQVFHLLSGLLGAVLMAQGRHAASAFAPLAYNLCIIAGGLLTGTAEGFAWGALAGSVVGPFLLPLVDALRTGLRWHLWFDPRDPDLRLYLVGALPIMLAFSLVGLDDFVWSHFASADAGDVSTLNYAKTLMKVPIGVFGFAMGQATYPELSKLYAENKRAEAWSLLRSAIVRSLLLAFAAQIVLTLGAAEAGVAVYSVRRIPIEGMGSLATCLAAFSLALAPWTVQTLVARGFYARGRTWIPTLWGSGLLLLSLPLYAAGQDLLGAPGLALASSVAISVYVVVLYARLAREVQEGPGIGADLGRMFLAAVLATGLGWGLRSALPNFGFDRLEALMRLAILSLAGGTFIATTRLLGVSEAAWLIARVRARLPFRS